MIKPVAFEPDVHQTIWGEEEWLVSAHRSAPSRVLGGGGKTLCDLCPGFPLLFKRIRADLRLSVQIHPNDETALTVGGEAKTEMWCVLEPGPIFAGFRPGVTESDIVRAVEDGSFESLLARFEAKRGECYFIPGGLVHAIGEGTTVYEVQQSSDTTFRLYDWGRVGADGKPRRLHVKEALAAMDLSIPPPTPLQSVDCRYFSFNQVDAGRVEPSDFWRVAYTPQARISLLLPPGAELSVESKTFIVNTPLRNAGSL